MEKGKQSDTQGEHATPCFARTSMEGHIELRVWVPREVVDVLDAEVVVRGGESANVYRATVVTEVLGPWAKKKIHDASVLLRVAGGNPTRSAEPLADSMRKDG